MKGLKDIALGALEALGRHEHDWNNVYIGERSNAEIDKLPPYPEADIAFSVAVVLRAETPDCADCANKRMGYDDDQCHKSQKSCGHHCNHSWSHDSCCWCSAEWGEDGVRLDRMSPAKRIAYDRWADSGDPDHWSAYEETP